MAEKFALLVIGWLLGLLGPAIVDAIRRKRENRLGREAILSELSELGNTLALATYAIRMDQRRVDRPFLEWLKTDIEHFATTQELQELVPRLHSLITKTDKELLQAIEHIALNPRKATMLQHYSAPLLDARVSALWSFETSLQRGLLDIKHEMALLDDLVDRSRKYFDLTFTNLEGNNYALVQENLEQACTEYSKRAERIVGKIRRLRGNKQ